MKVPPRYCRPIYVIFPTFLSDLNLRTSVRRGERHVSLQTLVPKCLKGIPMLDPRG